MNNLVCLSGGLDSAVILADLVARNISVTAIHCYYSHPASTAEDWHASRLCKRLGVDLIKTEIRPPKSGIMTGGADPVVTHRNVLILAAACAEATARNIDQVLIGATAEDNELFADCRAEFFAAFNAMQRSIGGPQVAAPLLHSINSDIHSIALELGIEPNDTWSCYNPLASHNRVRPGWLPCKNCLSCAVRGEL